MQPFAIADVSVANQRRGIKNTHKIGEARYRRYTRRRGTAVTYLGTIRNREAIGGRASICIDVHAVASERTKNNMRTGLKMCVHA